MDYKRAAREEGTLKSQRTGESSCTQAEALPATLETRQHPDFNLLVEMWSLVMQTGTATIEIGQELRGTANLGQPPKHPRNLFRSSSLLLWEAKDTFSALSWVCILRLPDCLPASGCVTFFLKNNNGFSSLRVKLDEGRICNMGQWVLFCFPSGGRRGWGV